MACSLTDPPFVTAKYTNEKKSVFPRLAEWVYFCAANRTFLLDFQFIFCAGFACASIIDLLSRALIGGHNRKRMNKEGKNSLKTEVVANRRTI